MLTLKNKRPKFKIGQHVMLNGLGRMFAYAVGRGVWPVEDIFLVLGDEDRTAQDLGHRYLLESLRDYSHPIFWAPEDWLVKTEDVDFEE